MTQIEVLILVIKNEASKLPPEDKARFDEKYAAISGLIEKDNAADLLALSLVGLEHQP